MGWSSILPEPLTILETWIVRVFLVLSILTFGPWAVLIIYDLLLYIWRSVVHEVPIVGGRAQGRLRPRAPSLRERPDGHRRRISLVGRPISISGNSSVPFASGSAFVEDSEKMDRKRETRA
ncbi:hypothetical protein EJ05DRAFT_483555 [Pseudovirgaria hyperparasitica]|uniref:Uncharacterized protein n=1 Tax=Pseudovirgaria hyperparasitica TaxID=470096 RepID=A0A6A6WG28_9PEZI|nr:uncharacterized protein EJ05DRAFT_483555 [Pseudovirgaria hyperparasitica]KAF2761159.1 hypothetical protein EJ05DRAFT_483555 [Pseudovirgaria hyperparasitica]